MLRIDEALVKLQAAGYTDDQWQYETTARYGPELKVATCRNIQSSLAGVLILARSGRWADPRHGLVLSDLDRDIVLFAIDNTGRGSTYLYCRKQHPAKPHEVRLCPVAPDRGLLPPDELYRWIYLLPGFSVPVENGSSRYIRTTISQLSRVQFDDNFQRGRRNGHCIDILQSILAQCQATGKVHVLGVLIVGVLEGTYYIIDGQHRLHAYKLLFDDRGIDFQLMVQMIFYDTFADLKRDFDTHNRNLPILEDEHRAIVEAESPVITRPWFSTLAMALVDLIGNTWKGIIVHQATHRPRIDSNRLTQALEKWLSRNEQKYKEITADQLLDLLRVRNDYIEKNPKMWKTAAGESLKARNLGVCKETGCYLGCVSIDEWFK